ncbi:MAG: Xaa-Pro dipeptidase [Bacillales bacterium]|jgi:uncharacterized YigZ family protein|nr:Xaa-Pro dipeptidase [Bacillales bacterium]
MIKKCERIKEVKEVLATYHTVTCTGEHEIIIQKSRFIANIARVETEAAAQDFIQQIKKMYWDATHNCSAYMIGEHDQIQKANDDGEPSGTAGVPILEVLKKRKLKDTVIVVTRYFGGIKLGAGGLIRAYGSCASEGLNHIGIVERRLMQNIHVIVDYTLLGKLENEIRNAGFTIKQIQFLENVNLEVLTEESSKQNLIDWLFDLSNGKAAFVEGEFEYIEIEQN